MKKILLVLLILTLFLLSGCVDYQKKYEELETKYDNLYSEYFEDKDSFGQYLDYISESASSVEDDLVTLYCYFYEEGISFDEALNAFDRLDSFWFYIYEGKFCSGEFK